MLKSNKQAIQKNKSQTLRIHAHTQVSTSTLASLPESGSNSNLLGGVFARYSVTAVGPEVPVKSSTVSSKGRKRRKDKPEQGRSSYNQGCSSYNGRSSLADLFSRIVIKDEETVETEDPTYMPIAVESQTPGNMSVGVAEVAELVHVSSASSPALHFFIPEADNSMGNSPVLTEPHVEENENEEDAPQPLIFTGAYYSPSKNPSQTSSRSPFIQVPTSGTGTEVNEDYDISVSGEYESDYSISKPDSEVYVEVEVEYSSDE